MRIGLAGAHRSGKTTLARLVSKERNVPFVQSPASAVVKEFGFDMMRDNRLDFEDVRSTANNTGISMQWAIYLRLVHDIEKAGDHFVTDRTPIDVAAYLLADATGYAGEEWSRAETVRMVQRAVLDTQRLFDIVILVPPGIQYVVEEGKPAENEAYQEHHHMLCRGILFDEDLDVYWDEIRRTTHTISARMEFVNGMIDEWLNTTQLPAPKKVAA